MDTVNILLVSFILVCFFRFYQFILYKFMDIPLSFYETDNPFKKYVLEICILLSSVSCFLLLSKI